MVLIADTGVAFPKYIAYKTTVETITGKGIEGFIREARRMFKASGHSLILTPYYITHVIERPLICMRYMKMSLRDYLHERKKLDLTESLVLIVQVVKGLLYLKERGISAHQDLKPENILLEDLSKFYGDFTYPLNLKVRIADFGLADAWREAGIPGGTYPYRAPEQYIERGTRFNVEYFKPDVFSLGIILTEMLTGLHPCGLSYREICEKKLNGEGRYWENWSINGRRFVEVSLPELQRLLLQMLEQNPRHRPPLEMVYQKLITLLERIDAGIHKQLKLLLEQYDTLAKYYVETRSYIDDQLKLLEIRSQKIVEDVLDALRCQRENVKNPVNPSEAVLLCRLDNAIGRALLMKKHNSTIKDEVLELAREVMDTVDLWRDKIEVEHVWPRLEFRGEEVIKLESATKYEAHAELVKMSLELLINTLREEEIINFLDRYDEYLKSTYHFMRALELYLQSIKKIKDWLLELDKAISLTPDEAILRYFKALWIRDWVHLWMYYSGQDHLSDFLNEDEKIEVNDVCTLLKEGINEVCYAIKLDRNWSEPSKLLELIEELKQLYEMVCY